MYSLPSYSSAQRNFLAVATRCAKPSDDEFQRLLSETANAIAEIQKFREARRSSPVFNHLSGVSESIPALAWVTVVSISYFLLFIPFCGVVVYY